MGTPSANLVDLWGGVACMYICLLGTMFFIRGLGVFNLRGRH